MTDAAMTQALDLARAGLNRPAMRTVTEGGARQDAAKVAQDFEAFFLTQMLEQMTADIATDGMFGGGNGEKVYRSLLNQEYGKAIAAQGGVGIAPMVMRDILAMQEQANQ